jgi:hypothetical protein
MLRGKLEVFSEVGKGSIFRLTLPPTIDARISRAIEQVVEPTVEEEGADDAASDSGDGAYRDNGRERVPAAEPRSGGEATTRAAGSPAGD